MSDPQDPPIWAEDPLIRALREPGTPEELAGEAEYVAAFRAATTLPVTESVSGPVSEPVSEPARSMRRIGRLGIGTASAMATVVLTGGVAAAAYTQTLPGPVQEIAHGVLGPIGVPAPPAQRREATPAKKREATPATSSARPTPAPTPTARPARTEEPTGTSHPEPSPDGPPAVPVAPFPSPPTATTTAPAPTPSTTPQPTPTAPAEPTTTTPAPPPAPPTLTGTASATRVPWHGSVVVTGHVTATDGSPVRRRPVALLGRRPGDTSWQLLGRLRTDRTGTVRLTTTVEATTRLVLRSGRGVRSAAMRVVMLPSVWAWSTPTPTGTQIKVRAAGAQSGDTVTLLRRQQGQLVVVTTRTLDAQGRAVIDLPPATEAGLKIRLERTPRHGAVRIPVAVGKATTP